MTVDASGRWAAPYGPFGGGQHQMRVRTDDGREGTAIYEITGAHHHRYFPVARGEGLPVQLPAAVSGGRWAGTPWA